MPLIDDSKYSNGFPKLNLMKEYAFYFAITASFSSFAIIYINAFCYQIISNGLHDITYGFGGRYDRGDAQDVEPMIYLPLKKFQKIEGATL